MGRHGDAANGPVGRKTRRAQDAANCLTTLAPVRAVGVASPSDIQIPFVVAPDFGGFRRAPSFSPYRPFAPSPRRRVAVSPCRPFAASPHTRPFTTAQVHPIFPALMWLSIFIPILLTILVIVCVLLVLVVLMQRPRSEGLGAAFGSGMTENIFGAQTTTVLTKATVYLGGIFFGVTLIITILVSRQSSERRTGLLENELKNAKPVPAATVAPNISAVPNPTVAPSGIPNTSATPQSSVNPQTSATPVTSATPEASATPVASATPAVTPTPVPSPTAATTP